MLLSFLSLVCGLILDTVTRGRRETKRLAYLQAAAPAELAQMSRVGDLPVSSAR